MLRQVQKRLTPDELASLYDESAERRPSQERDSWLNDRLEVQLQYAYDMAPAMRRKFDEAGVLPSQIRSVDELPRLPVTKKGELVRLQQNDPPFGGLLGVPADSLSRVYVSPGPIYDAWGPERISAQLRTYLRDGFPKPGDVVLVSLSYHMVPAGLFLTDVLDLMGCSVVPAGTGQTELQVKLLRDLQATAILSFPSFVMSVLRKAEEMGYDVRTDLNLKYVVGGGERHGQMLKKVFREKYGLVVGDGYGTADVGPVAYDCGLDLGYHFDDEQAVVEIVDPDSGRQVNPHEVGEVVITPFSRTYPLVRLGTGDLASYTDEICPCGRTSPRIVKILGVIGDHVRVKGMFVHGREVAEAMSRFPTISRYQMVVTLDGHRDHVTLRVELLDGANCESLPGQIDGACQQAFKLRMDEIDFVPSGTLSEGSNWFLDLRWK